VDGRSDNALDVGTIPRDRKHVEAVRYTRKLGSSDTAVGNESSRLHGLSAGYDKHLSTRWEISFCEELVVRVMSLLGNIANAPIISNQTCQQSSQSIKPLDNGPLGGTWGQNRWRNTPDLPARERSQKRNSSWYASLSPQPT
jgi:hypothetical protein